MTAQLASRLLVASVLWLVSTPSQGAQGHTDRVRELSPDQFQWFSVPILVENLPQKRAYVPVSSKVDFSALLAELNVEGAPDERSIRLLRQSPEGNEFEVPFQFSPETQRRPEHRRMLPATTNKVSYVGEYGAGETPKVPRVIGTLTWIVGQKISPQENNPSLRRYRLIFGVSNNGRLVQVPFPPQNLRGFDSENRATPIRWFPVMQIRPQWPLNGEVSLLQDHQLVTTFHLGPMAEQVNEAVSRSHRPYLYPVNGPDGINLTELGKPHDPTGSHAHHYSLWIAHASVDGEDFWSERGGHILHDRFELLEDGPVFCRLIQRNRWTKGHKEFLHEKRELILYSAPQDFRILDVELEFTCPADHPVVLGQTTFGFFAVRIAQSMTPFDGGGEITNAEGDLNEREVHLSRSPWLDLSGPVAPGKWAGIAIFDHPENPRHPTGWHCRNDGWAGAAFNMLAPYTLQPGETLRLRYRVFIHRHDARGGKVPRHYENYGSSPVIQLGEPSAL